MAEYYFLKYDPKKSTINYKQLEMIIYPKNIKDCKSLKKDLFDSGIIFSSISNNTVINFENDKNDKNTGCSIVMDNISVQQVNNYVWEPLKEKFNLDKY